MRVKGKYTPEMVDLSDFKVFISYKTEDWEFASAVAKRLGGLGFQILVVPPPPPAQTRMSDAELEAKLSPLVRDADCICLVASALALRSNWVRFEFKEAVESIGRIVFVCNESVLPAGDMLMADLEPGELSQNILVRHTTLYFHELTEQDVSQLAAQLLNDPDEGWLDGRAMATPASISRDLKRTSLMKKRARSQVLQDGRYAGTMILDVIAFTWQDAGCEPGDIVGARHWAILGCGRTQLEIALINGECDMDFESYVVTGVEIGSSKETESLNVFVVTRRLHREL